MAQGVMSSSLMNVGLCYIYQTNVNESKDVQKNSLLFATFSRGFLSELTL